MIQLSRNMRNHFSDYNISMHFVPFGLFARYRQGCTISRFWIQNFVGLCVCARSRLQSRRRRNATRMHLNLMNSVFLHLINMLLYICICCFIVIYNFPSLTIICTDTIFDRMSINTIFWLVERNQEKYMNMVGNVLAQCNDPVIWSATR